MVNPIKLQLLLKGIRQIDLAREANVGKSFVCQVVAGREKPSPKVKKAFEKFGIEVEDTAK